MNNMMTVKDMIKFLQEEGALNKIFMEHKPWPKIRIVDFINYYLYDNN